MNITYESNKLRLLQNRIKDRPRFSFKHPRSEDIDISRIHLSSSPFPGPGTTAASRGLRTVSGGRRVLDERHDLAVAVLEADRAGRVLVHGHRALERPVTHRHL